MFALLRKLCPCCFLRLPRNTDVGAAEGFWEQPGGHQVSSCPVGNAALGFLPRTLPCWGSFPASPVLSWPNPTQGWFAGFCLWFFTLKRRCCVSLGGVCTPSFFPEKWEKKNLPYRRGHRHFHCHISPCAWLCSKGLWLAEKPKTQRLTFNQTKTLLCLLPAVVILSFLCPLDREDRVPPIRNHWWPGLMVWSQAIAEMGGDLAEQIESFLLQKPFSAASGCKMNENFVSCFNFAYIFGDRWWLMNGIYPSWQSIYLAFIFLGTGGILWKEYYPMGHLLLISIVSSK